jgi:23S rRNA (cytosine1962-C5)-methyltransferase
MDLPQLRLKRGEDRRLRAGHLWVFSNEVDTSATPLAPGAQASIVGHRGEFLGFAYVNPGSLIAARIVSRHATAPIDAALLRERLRAALALRARLAPRPYYRAVFGESDGLPGLVLDRYGDVVVGQVATAGMGEIESAIRAVIAPTALVWKNDSAARHLEGLSPQFKVAWGDVPAAIRVVEAPLAGRELEFHAPLAAGQKTGWFYDQTANRMRLTRYLPRGAKVLDVCSYVGAWAVTAMAAGASSATCIDASALALEYATRNAIANGFEVECLCDGAFDALERLAQAGARYDAVILDPPAFIKRRKDAAQGQAAYRKLNQLGLRLLQPGGLLLSCSCSYHLASSDLLAALQTAARHVDRFVQVLEIAGQSPDHPVHPAIPETRYLKALFCHVTREV